MSAEEPRVLVVLPLYNNGRTVAAMSSEIAAMGRPLLVVNDGSTDGGPASLDGLALERIDFPRNRGKGRVLRFALRWARERGYSHIITIDADGQHAPADIDRFAARIREDPGRLIIGRRNFAGDVPGKSRFGRRWSNMWVRIASGGRTPDSQSGFRAYPVAPLAGRRYLGTRYEFEVEVLVRAVWAGLPLDWVDITLCYFPAAGRVSHFRPFLDNFRISLIYTVLVVRNFLPFPFRRRLPCPDARPRAEHTEAAKARVRFSPKALFRRLALTLSDAAGEGNTPAEIAWAGWLGAFLGAFPLIGVMGRAVKLYARRFGLDTKVALAVNRIGSPWVRPALLALAVEGGHFLRSGRFFGRADLGSLDAVVRLFGRGILGRLWEAVIGGFWLGCLGGAIAFVGIFIAARRKRALAGGGHGRS